MVGQRRQRALQIDCGQDERNPGRICGSRQIQRANTGVRERAPDERDVKHAGQHEIGYVLAATDKQAPILAPRERASHESIACRLRHQWRLNACWQLDTDNSSTTCGKLKYR